MISELKNDKRKYYYALKILLKKRTKRVTQNSVKFRENPTRKKVHSKSRKILKRKNNYSFSESINIVRISMAASLIFVPGPYTATAPASNK